MANRNDPIGFEDVRRGYMESMRAADPRRWASEVEEGFRSGGLAGAFGANIGAMQRVVGTPLAYAAPFIGGPRWRPDAPSEQPQAAQEQMSTAEDQARLGLNPFRGREAGRGTIGVSNEEAGRRLASGWSIEQGRWVPPEDSVPRPVPQATIGSVSAQYAQAAPQPEMAEQSAFMGYDTTGQPMFQTQSQVKMQQQARDRVAQARALGQPSDPNDLAILGIGTQGVAPAAPVSPQRPLTAQERQYQMARAGMAGERPAFYGEQGGAVSQQEARDFSGRNERTAIERSYAEKIAAINRAPQMTREAKQRAREALAASAERAGLRAEGREREMFARGLEERKLGIEERKVMATERGQDIQAGLSNRELRKDLEVRSREINARVQVEREKMLNEAEKAELARREKLQDREYETTRENLRAIRDEKWRRGRAEWERRGATEASRVAMVNGIAQDQLKEYLMTPDKKRQDFLIDLFEASPTIAKATMSLLGLEEENARGAR